MLKFKVEYLCTFLIVAFVLATPNYGVAVLVILCAYSIYTIKKSTQKYTLIKIDWLIIAAMSSYFIGFIPNAIHDGTTFRYFDAPLRFLMCIPIYLLFRKQLQLQKISSNYLKKSLEYGAIAGSIGAFILAIYQSQVLKVERVGGFLFSINFGYLACSLAFLCLVFFRQSTHKVFNFIGFGCAIVGTFLTITRGAIFAIPILLAISLIVMYKDKLSFTNVITTLFIVSALFTLAYKFNDKINERINFTVYEAKELLKGNTAKAESTGGRIQLWHGAIEAFKKSPMIGLPYHQREAINKQIYQHSRYKNSVILTKRGHAHNQYFEVLAAAGILGVLALMSYLLLPMIFYAMRYKKNTANICALNGFVFTLGFALFGITEVPLEANSISSFYAFVQVTLLALTIHYDSQTPQRTASV